MTWLIFIAISLGVFRLTRLIVADKITAAFRREAKEHGGKNIGYLVQCPWCASFYVTVLAVAYLMWIGIFTWIGAPLWGFAIWGLSNIINQIFVALTE